MKESDKEQLTAMFLQTQGSDSIRQARKMVAEGNIQKAVAIRHAKRLASERSLDLANFLDQLRLDEIPEWSDVWCQALALEARKRQRILQPAVPYKAAFSRGFDNEPTGRDKKGRLGSCDEQWAAELTSEREDW